MTSTQNINKEKESICAYELKKFSFHKDSHSNLHFLLKFAFLEDSRWKLLFGEASIPKNTDKKIISVYKHLSDKIHIPNRRVSVYNTSVRHPYLFNCTNYTILGDRDLNSAECLLSNTQLKPFVGDEYDNKFCHCYMPIFDNGKLCKVIPNTH